MSTISTISRNLSRSADYRWIRSPHPTTSNPRASEESVWTTRLRPAQQCTFLALSFCTRERLPKATRIPTKVAAAWPRYVLNMVCKQAGTTAPQSSFWEQRTLWHAKRIISLIEATLRIQQCPQHNCCHDSSYHKINPCKSVRRTGPLLVQIGVWRDSYRVVLPNHLTRNPAVPKWKGQSEHSNESQKWPDHAAAPTLGDNSPKSQHQNRNEYNAQESEEDSLSTSACKCHWHWPWCWFGVALGITSEEDC